jgi:hypothetical protein
MRPVAAAGAAAAVSPCDAALREALRSPQGAAAALSRHLSLRQSSASEPLPPCAAGGAPCVTVLCRRSDAGAAADAAFEPASAWPAVLAAGGRAVFVQPSARQGVVHVIEDRLGAGAGAGAAAEEVASLLAHELVHAADALLHGWDLARAAALACSEVRAAGLADCAQAAGAGAAWPGGRARCVRGAARRSTDMSFPGAGAAAVDAVFAACHDTPLVLGDAAAQRAALRAGGGAALAAAVLDDDAPQGLK